MRTGNNCPSGDKNSHTDPECHFVEEEEVEMEGVESEEVALPDSENDSDGDGSGGCEEEREALICCTTSAPKS